MKHFTQTTANGLHPTPCGSSQSKSTRFSLLTSFLLLFLMFVGSNAAWAEFVTYNGTEFFFWNSHQKINGGQWGHIISDNRNMYLRFHNTSTNATAWSSKETDKGAVQWDGDVWSDSSPYGIHAAKVPAGTWNEVTVVRSWDHSPSVNETGGTFTLQSGKNYIGPGDDGLGVYTPRFYLPGNSALSGNDWTWNGNGTVYTGVAELSLSAGTTYKFKITPAGASGWGTEANMDHYDSEGSNVTCTDGNNKECWFTLSEAATVRIAFDGQKITVNTVTPEPEPEPATFQGGEVFYMKQNTICKDGNSHDFLKYGRCDFNLYDEGGIFLDKALSAQVIPGTDPVMLKFVVPAEYAGTVWGQVKVKQLETGGAGHNETNKGAIPKDGKNYLINGNTMEWGTYVETVTYTGNEFMFLSKQQKNSGNGNIFNFTADGAHLFVYFWNSETSANAWSDEAFMWDSGDNVLGAKVPAGTWTNCKVVRKNSNDSGKNWNNVWNESHNQTLEAGKNYLRTGESSVWAVYTPPFYLTGSSVLCGADWGYTGNGTTYNGSATRTNIPMGTYQFKLNPTKNYNNWEHQINYTHIASSGSNVTLSQQGDKNIQFTLSEASDVTIAYDGYGVTVNATPYAPPAVTRTVTIHPNNGAENFTMDVADGGTISSIAATYGNGIASWYKDEELTQAFTLNSSTVTEDMDLFAKWGVSGNYYIGGDLWMHEKNGNNWAYYSTMAMTTTDGVASVTYIAPKGRNRFEILNTRSNWATIPNQGSGLIAASTPTLSWAKYGPDNNYHFVFDLDAPKKVTIRYNGKVSITAEDYDVIKTGWTVVSPTLFGHGSDDNAEYADNGAFMSGYNVTEGQMNENGERVFRNVNPGTYKFWIGKYNTNLDKTKQQIEVFGAANVDKATSSLSGYGSLADNNNAHINLNIPQDDKLHRRVTFTLTQKADIKIAFDGGKIKVNVLPTHTVTFKNGETTFTTAQVFDGNVATAPTSNPEKAGHEFTGWDWNFTTPITGDQIINAQFSYKPIESVSLNESTHMTWVGNTDFTLTPTYDPSDLIAKDVAWSSDNTSVATVSDGTVHVKADAGITEETVVHITCTVTDQYDVSRSAYCDVTVAPCQMTTDNLYSMNVTGYNSSTGNSATLTGLWNSSEPATLTAYHLTITPGKDGTKRYLYADASDNYVKRNTSSSAAEADNYYWIRTNVGTTGSSLQIFTLQNYGILKNEGTNAFLSSASSNAITTNWGAHRAIVQEDGTANVAKWHFIDGCGAKMMNMAFSNGDNNYSTHETFLHVDTELGYGDIGMTMSDESIVAVGSSDDCQNRPAHRPALEGAKSVPNPAYIPSQMNSSYYRMNTNATVQANLAAALVKGAVITVSLYADAATSVKLTKTDGTEIATIDLSADAALDYTYTVNTASLLLGESAFIIKAADNHAGIASISVSRTHAVEPDDPALAWDDDDLETTGITQSALGGNIVHTAASDAGSTGAISYTSSNTAVADIEADGTVLPHMAGSTTITATIEEAGCYDEASITYTITLTEPTLAERIAADAGEGITLTRDYAEDAVINKAITIDGGGHTIGNLTVEMAGDLTLSGALTVNDFSIYAQAGNNTVHAASGQVRNATNLTVNGNAYFFYTVEPGEHVQYGWYDFTVPFPVNTASGIKGIQDEVLKETFAYGTDYAILAHYGDKHAQGEYPYKKFQGVMQPCRLYSITLDDDFNYKTLRFQKTNDGALVAGDNVTLHEYTGEVSKDNWNGVGNGTLHHANVGVSAEVIQVYQSGVNTFMTETASSTSLAIGTAFMIQEAGTMTLNQATHSPLLAPKREASVQPTAIQIASEGKPFSDQLFISADETAGQGYTQGVDVAKAGNIGNVNVPQIWTNAYDSKLCAHEAQLINGQAAYALSLYAPANGTYTLTSKNIPEGYTLYLTQNGNKIWDMSDAYVIDLTKGTTNEYGLLLVERYNAPTGIENGEWTNGEAQKVLRNGVLYIIRNGEVYDAQGARVK